MKPEILERMRRPRPKGRQTFENRLGKFERDLTLLKSMVGFNLALTVAIVARSMRLFFHSHLNLKSDAESGRFGAITKKDALTGLGAYQGICRVG